MARAGILESMPAKDFRFGISSSVQGVDLNQLLVAHPLSTYFMRMAQDIPELDLLAEDIVLVDRALTPRAKDLVVVAETADPELKIARYEEVTEQVELWGVVQHVIRKMRP